VKRKQKRGSKLNTEKARGPITSATAGTVTEIAKSVRALINHIAISVANGDKLAALELYKIVSRGTACLNFLALRRPHLFSPIAKSKMSWPLFWGPHPEQINTNKEIASWLKLGSGFGINFSQPGKIFSLHVPANEVAIHLLRLAQSLRSPPIDDWNKYDWMLLGPIGDLEDGVLRNAQQVDELQAWGRRAQKILPQLSRATVREWKSPMRELFRIVYGEKFDQHSDLQDLKKSVIGHAKDVFGKQGPGVIRKAMLSKVLQALKSIAPLD
jgi:hypothetical protein